MTEQSETIPPQKKPRWAAVVGVGALVLALVVAALVFFKPTSQDDSASPAPSVPAMSVSPSASPYPNQEIGQIVDPATVGISTISLMGVYVDGKEPSYDKAAEQTSHDIQSGALPVDGLRRRALAHVANLRAWGLCSAELQAAARAWEILADTAADPAAALRNRTLKADFLAAGQLASENDIPCIAEPSAETRWLVFDVQITRDGTMEWRRFGMPDSMVLQHVPSADRAFRQCGSPPKMTASQPPIGVAMDQALLALYDGVCKPSK